MTRRFGKRLMISMDHNHVISRSRPCRDTSMNYKSSSLRATLSSWRGLSLHQLVTEVFAQDDAPTGSETQPDSTLGECAIPDTACCRTLVGAYTLQLIEQTLRKFGLKVLRRKEVSEFRFGIRRPWWPKNLPSFQRA